MKARDGFVSNSSSSSFILATDGNSDKLKITMEIDISSLVDHVIKTIEQLDEYYQREIVDQENEWSGEKYTLKGLLQSEEHKYHKKEYDKMKAQIEMGNTCYLGQVSNEDYDGMGSYFYSDGFPKMDGVEVIKEGN